MGFESIRLGLLALLWGGAGALAYRAAAQPSLALRDGVPVLLLFAAGLALAWPMARALRQRRLQPQLLPAEPAQPLDLQRLHLLQAQFEHLPVAAWVLGHEGDLRALSNRARRLAAPGGVREAAALQQLLRSAERSGPVSLDTERGSERWQLQMQTLSLDGQGQTLLVLVPLERELEGESLQAWQQLVQILTHEIMNSLTPIKSLSQTAQMLLDEPPLVEADLRSALDGIAQRAEGLSRFVATYRRVSQWPAPVLAPVDLHALFQRLRLAVAPAWERVGGQLSFEVSEPGLRLNADEGQLEQALLALIHNAEQACAEQELPPRLWLTARQGRGGRLQISVRDNGPGVPPGLERKIFLPFFSAREGGQGIGLTVVRQLVHGMGGRVRYVRPLEGGAAFVLSF
ncbi:sensor histidine kinase [Paucibacter sp. Y2R2-4]|uniref:sensor histidine kinase n=1 Tax=Paucibacter sp. Y2R2-4 TaxID=2893553 RepID=UPI0021E41AF3|nr:ATP-binding protein [Paucibacter sp. Y2R2-4]MCV2351232.1 ATP-binding protein [Paucibacter sp. Y2R2-4]